MQCLEYATLFLCFRGFLEMGEPAVRGSLLPMTGRHQMAPLHSSCKAQPRTLNSQTTGKVRDEHLNVPKCKTAVEKDIWSQGNKGFELHQSVLHVCYRERSL